MDIVVCKKCQIVPIQEKTTIKCKQCGMIVKSKELELTVKSWNLLNAHISRDTKVSTSV